MSKQDPKYIRNFSIIAHIDHGKSTISDRLLEKTGTVEARLMKEQLLDAMELEREKGITIKAHPVTMYYKAKDGHNYQMNFIDTPGHVDFTYEVSRSLSSCEGALLIVDAAQGVQAQSIANVHLAIERDLEIIPVLNKIDLPAADVEGSKSQIEEVIGIDASEAILCSGKTGEGIEELLEAIVHLIPPPKPIEETALKALVFDSVYDTYRGVMVYIRVYSGMIKRGSIIEMMKTGKTFEVLEVGIFCPLAKKTDHLHEGEVGYVIANIKNVRDVKIGDTITEKNHKAKQPIRGFKEIKPVVFAGIYPVDTSDFEGLKEALYKLQLNDSALFVEQETTQALGFGFRCGFLGLLHLEIIFERLQREFQLDVITTAASVSYPIKLRNGATMHVDNAAHFPDPSTIEMIQEPWVIAHVMIPSDFMGAVMNLGMEKRGECVKTESVDKTRLLLTYKLPLNEIITDFNDKLKSFTKGYGSFDYEMADHHPSDIIKLEIKVNEEVVDAFSCLVHRTKAESRGRAICEKLKEVIPRQLFKVPIQAAIGGKIIARETLSALSKNVTAKCYGGDITRKRKLWEKQKKGKKKMKEIGKVQIPQSAFMEVLKTTEI